VGGVFPPAGGRSIFGTALFRNDGEAGFEEVSDEVGVESFWPWGLSVGDLNADGLQDVFITAGMNYPFRYGVNTLLLNDGGHFAESEFILGVEPRRQGRTSKPWFELDCSGEDADDELVCGKYELDGRVAVWAALDSRSSVIFDLDVPGHREQRVRGSRQAPLWRSQRGAPRPEPAPGSGHISTPYAPEAAISRRPTASRRDPRGRRRLPLRDPMTVEPVEP
jgi:hypothetical protein